MSALLGTFLPLVMLAVAASPVLGQLRERSHPRLLLLEAFHSGFVLVIASATLGDARWIAGAWWAVLALIVVAQGVSWIRLVRRADGDTAVGVAADGIAAASGAQAASPAVDGAAGDGPAGGDDGPGSTDHPARRREKPPGPAALAVNAVLWAAAVGASLLAG